MRDEEMLAGIEDCLEGFNQPTAGGSMAFGWLRGRASAAEVATVRPIGCDA
jgi:hypothetical protein